MPKAVDVLAHGSLTDFLLRTNVKRPSASRRYVFDYRSIAKDAVESAGIPHTEVDLLLADGVSIPFDWELRDGARIEAFPYSHPATLSVRSLVRPPPLASLKFLVDENLGKLATFLLILGFDVAFDPKLDDAGLALKSAQESRFLLTRDIGLLKRSLVTHGYWVRSDDPRTQVSEVIHRCDLWSQVRPFTRCLECNDKLDMISKEEAAGRVPPVAHAAYKEFYKCQSCQKVFWKGSHYDRMRDWLKGLWQEFEPRP